MARSNSRSRSRSRHHTRSRSPIRSQYNRRSNKESRLPPSRLRSRSHSPHNGQNRRYRDNGRETTRCDRSPPHDPKKTKDSTHLVDKWGKKEDFEIEDEESVQPIEKPNFGLSGALAKDRVTGNIQNGVVMKWSEPAEAKIPTKQYRLYVFKDDTLISTLHVHRKSAFLVGRDKAVADILTEHASCSKQHAVLQYRLFQKPSSDGLTFENEIRPYIMDLGSTNGTILNGQKIEFARYIELKVKDVLKFGESTREYVFMDAS